MLGLRRNGKTKIYKSTYRAGNITQWLCRAITLCIISVKIYAAIMAKVTFEIKSSLNKVKKFYRPPGWHFFFAMRVIGNEQFLKVGLTELLNIEIELLRKSAAKF